MKLSLFLYLAAIGPDVLEDARLSLLFEGLWKQSLWLL